MEYNSKLERNPKVHRSSKTSEKTMVPQANQKLRLQGRIKTDKWNLSRTDDLNCVKGAPISPLGSCQKRWMVGKASEDELIKYMSKLPNYLERGDHLQDKVLSVGVLDWGRLEKWQYGHKQEPHRTSSYSPSSSHTSSSYSADGSTTDSSGGHSCSPARHKTRSSSLQFHLTSPVEDQSSVAKSFGKSETKFENAKNGDGFRTFRRTHMSDMKCHAATGLVERKGEELDTRNGDGFRASSNQVNHKEVSCPQVYTETENGEVKSREEMARLNCLHMVNQDVPRRPKEVAVLPSDLSQIKHPGAHDLSDSRPILGRRSAEASQKSISGRFKDIYPTKLGSDAAHTCLLPGEADCSTNLMVKRPSSIHAESSSHLSDGSHTVLHSPKVRISPSRGRRPEEKESVRTPERSRESELSNGLNLKAGNVTAEKPRSSSPFRRLSISLGKVGKSSGCRDDSALPQSIATFKSANTNSENAMPSAYGNKSCRDRSSSAGKSRSSPLRRLLDPLLKPKATNSGQLSDSLQKDSISINMARKSSNKQVDSSTTKAKLDMTSCGKINVNDSYQDKRDGSMAVQALVRVTSKNGLPLITFAVETAKDVLVATMKKWNDLEKDDCNWLYTFFVIQEVKRKSISWINQGGKGKGSGYTSNAVAQMKVYDAQSPNPTLENSPRQFSLREFVLFSGDLKSAEQQATEFQPSDEIAAIVVKVPEKTFHDSRRDRNLDVRCHSNMGEVLQNKSCPISQGLNSATVILPSGVHGLPSRGIPSSLIDRWKSGGSCDCGGWDLGCKLRILSNQNQLSRKVTLPRDHSIASKFELFSQEGGQEEKPIFSLAPFKDGVFSVAFRSSLSRLQAFSICIAILESMKAFELSESSGVIEEKH